MPAVGLVQDPDLAAAAVDRVDGMLGMAGGQKNLQVGPQAGGRLRKLGAEHAAGHHDIGEQKVDFSALRNIPSAAGASRATMTR